LYILFPQDTIALSGQENPILFEPDDDEIKDELVTQSVQLFTVIGLGGVLGPAMYQFDAERPDHWPYSQTILKWFGLSKNAEGWRCLLRAFGFVPPTPSDVQSSSYQRRNSPAKKKFVIPHEDDDYPGLVGNSVSEVVMVTPTEGGYAIRTTVSIIQLR
jgi:hypothetical protein